jgi:hypothetical protein
MRMRVEVHPHRGKPEVRAANTHLLRTAPRLFPKRLLERVFEQDPTLHPGTDSSSSFGWGSNQ